jgi:glutamine phosphoribosylpyrophosphate amidotransferase
MCGVIAYFPHDASDGFDFDYARLIFTRVMQESKVRGLHSFGLAHVETYPVPTEYSPHQRTGSVSVIRAHSLELVTDAFQPAWPTIAHCRYSTSGDWHVLDNCQPIVVGDLALAFNGVIHMGTKEEYEAAFGVRCVSDNDGEVFLRRLIAGQVCRRSR